MDKVTAVLAIPGAFATVFTLLHVVFPKVALFQRLGIALRAFGGDK